nr:hypothetical protein [Streptomyces dysideae]
MIHEQAGRREAPVDEVGPVLDLLQLAFDGAGQVREIGSGEVGQAPFE